MSWNGKQGMQCSAGLGSSVYKPKEYYRQADGTGRDVHCFKHPRSIDTFNYELPNFETNVNAGSGRNKSPQIAVP